MIATPALDVEGVHCPLCEYDLRGLTEPRCPECGYRFDWAELLDPARRVHPYLFEHHPHHNLWSFYRTALGGWRSGRFWKLLRPQQPSRPGRMRVYWLISTALPAVLGGLLTGAASVADHVYPLRIVFSLDRRPAPVVTIERIAVAAPALFFASGFVFVWSLLTYFSLMVFQNSMVRARVNRIHVTRCVLYSFDIGFWIATVALLSFALPPSSDGSNTEDYLLAITLILLILAAARLWMAYRYYLSFDHPFGVILASQVIVALAMGVILINLSLLHILSL